MKKLVFSVFLIHLVTIVLFAQDNGSRMMDSLELVNFSKETQMEYWKHKWDFSQSMDTWYGVELNRQGRVFCIDLDGEPDCKSTKNGGNHLHGTLPELNLHFLEHLFLSSNKISGKVPSFSGTSNLLTLQLSGNLFSGRLHNFKTLPRLVKLDLEYNQLSGYLPDFDLPKLNFLYLGYNHFSGELPTFFAIPEVRHLYLNHNQFTGELPDYSFLEEMEQFIFNHNQFTGGLPDYTSLLQLQVLIGDGNKLKGCVEEKSYEHLRLFKMDDTMKLECLLCQLDAPTGFSPNGDGINDYFEVYLKKTDVTISTLKNIVIFDQDGRMVYENDNYTNEWNGKYLNTEQDLAEGLYIYFLKAEGQVYKRTIYLKR